MVKYLFFLLILISYGCSPATIKPMVLDKTELVPLAVYNIDTNIEKPEKPNPILLDDQFNETNDEENYKYIAFTYDDFLKIVKLSKNFDLQKEIIIKQKDLIDLYIADIELMRSLIKNKDLQLEDLNTLYTDEQNLRINQVFSLEKENFVLRIVGAGELALIILLII